jgi:hypothetical protein
MTSLSVNVNKFALLRNSRDTNHPDVAGMAERAIRCGVHGITVHPRPDQRHIRYSDLPVLRDLTRRGGVEFNIEGNPVSEFLDRVLRVIPEQCTLVPDASAQLTSDHGWDLPVQAGALVPHIRRLRDAGIRVSLFMDADPDAMDAARATGADRVALVILFSHAPAYWSLPTEGRSQTYLGWSGAQFGKRPGVMGRVLRRLYKASALPASQWDYLAYLEMQPQDVAHVREHLADLRDVKRNPAHGQVVREVELWLTKQIDDSGQVRMPASRNPVSVI